MYRIISKPAYKLRHFQRSLKRNSFEEEKEEQPSILIWRYHQILTPSSEVVTYWNRIFLFTSMIALFIDPFYFYLPHVGGPGCLTTDIELKGWVTVLRSIADLFHWLHIAMKFRTAFIAPSSELFDRGELVTDPRKIATHYLKTDFFIDLAASLPMPQIVIWLVFPANKDQTADHDNNTIALLVLFQYIPRLFLIYPLNHQLVKNGGLVARTPWTGAAYNLISYLIASHVVGASWYLSAIGRQFACWDSECGKDNQGPFPCQPVYLNCAFMNKPERQSWLNVTQVIANCDAKKEDDIKFKFGLFAAAFKDDVASSSFMKKYLYCLWWGLRGLSSYLQDMDTSTYIGENLFCVFAAIVGLALTALLIGNMQNYLQSMSARLEEWRLKKRDTEEWMRRRQLPPALQERVIKFISYQWLATKGVDEESILQSLPSDLRREIQRHLCLSLVRRVPLFSQMDDQLLDAICQRLVSSLSTEGTYIVREGDPVTEMLFIIRGQLESSTTNGGRPGFFNSITLRPNDFCGEELLTWALMPNSTANLPCSTRTVRALTEVEAFALEAEDLKFVASQFKRLHSKKIQHAFRYYSHQWRTRGACIIQAAWRNYVRRKELEELTLQESSYYYMDAPGAGNFYGDNLAYTKLEDDYGEGYSGAQ